MRCGGYWWPRPCRGTNATRRPATSPIVSGSLGRRNGVSTTTSSAASRNSYSPEPPMTPMLARFPATAGQATFEPDEEDEDEGEEDDDQEELPFPPDFLSPLPEDFSLDEVAAAPFLLSLLSDDPFADAAAGSYPFWLAPRP